MASFGSGCDVFDFGAWRPEEIPAVGNRLHLLWPALAWRVVAPIVRDTDLNVFQRTALALADGGVDGRKSIAEALGVDEELAGLVLAELAERGWLDGRTGRVTESGRKRLCENAWEDGDLVHARVFQDPFDGHLWPVFPEESPRAEVLWEPGRIRIAFGKKGEPQRLHPVTWVDGDAGAARQPTAAEILRTARRSARRQRERASDDEGWAVEETRAVARVSFVSDVPECVFLSTFAFVPASGEAPWLVCDPFGDGVSDRMRSLVERQLGSHPKLERELVLLVGDAAKVGHSDENQRLRALHEAAAFEVERRVTIAIRDHEGVFRSLVAMERDWSAVRVDANSPADRRADVLVKAQKVVEALCAVLQRDHRASDAWKELSESDADLNARLLRTWMEKLGLRVPADVTDSRGRPRVWRLLTVRRNKVRSALEYGSESLGPKLVALVLAARRHEAHPLRRAAKARPDLLVRMMEVATMRDRAGGHYSEHEEEPTARELQPHVEAVYAAVAGLLGLPLGEGIVE